MPLSIAGGRPLWVLVHPRLRTGMPSWSNTTSPPPAIGVGVSSAIWATPLLNMAGVLLFHWWSAFLLPHCPHAKIPMAVTQGEILTTNQSHRMHYFRTFNHIDADLSNITVVLYAADATANQEFVFDSDGKPSDDVRTIHCNSSASFRRRFYARISGSLHN